jgi:hypothetical protein
MLDQIRSDLTALPQKSLSKYQEFQQLINQTIEFSSEILGDEHPDSHACRALRDSAANLCQIDGGS